ncbi:Long chain acyl-CoA synthetase 6, peroxisomal [Psilocybe cubensis]|uniref:Long chain acyl-CoA synthetase 6, peroxisomal n=2 Tax=Psilocybe cubensis TaxID=181762 RepID=A0ACB8H8W5_PSICU|nr:Long chain acyl-CoA synthetase 6, peroxisomal [Psilocybe cubensis]KAH9484154.1 Long chain acyl-CoA synthetase 6, peroxisomal [Psilocybe cubensis]
MSISERVAQWPTVMPYDKQSVAVPGTKRPGQTAHYRNGIWGLVEETAPDLFVTLDQIFAEGLLKSKNKPFLGRRPILSTNPLKFAPTYTWQTYGEVDVKRRHIGSAVHTLFTQGVLGGGEYPTVGIWAPNCPEWQIVDIALQSYQKVSVSLYDTLGKDSVAYIIEHSHLTVIFATSEHIPLLLKTAHRVPMLKAIVCMDPLSAEASKLLREWSESQGLIFKEFAELEAFGKANYVEPIPAYPDLVASICYTSGTTNNPKGVVLKHKNLAVATHSNMYGLMLPEDACLLSYLPLAHIYERVCELCTIAVGGQIGYFTGDPLRLLEDAQILRPNFFPSVPRVLNRVYQAAMVGGNVPGLKGILFNKAVQTKLATLHQTGEVTHAFWDRLVFRKIQAVLGGRIKLVTSGSAPISSDVMDFLKIAFACEVAEGSGTVGPPQPINEIKLVDVPAMNYTSEDKPNPRGELCVRGANCFTTYYKDEKNTKETVDEEGWVHTGDVVELDSCGRVKIIDRVKNIMKLAQGEYVALEKIENVYSSTPLIAQIYVHSDGLQSFLIAVIVPDPVQFSGIVSSVTGNKVAPEDVAALAAACKDSRVISHVESLLMKIGKQNGLKGFEIVKRVHLSLTMFSVENNTLTPTMKVRRKDAYNMYKKELDALYALGEPSSKL